MLRRSLLAARHAAARRRQATRALSTIIHKSPHPDLEIPDKTFLEIVKDQLPQNAKRNAIICGLSHEAVTFEEMYDSARRIAAGLALDGVKKGDVLLLHSFNCVEYPLIVLASYALGAICSTASPMFNAQELAQQARIAQAKLIVTNRALENVAIEAAELSGIAKSSIYTVGGSDEPQKLKSINELMKRDFEFFNFEPVDPSLPSLLPFSSGTTGLPKGVALSARNMVANTLQVSHVENFGDHVLGVLPFFHIYAMMLLHLAMYQGAANIVLPRFEPESFLTALSKYRVQKANIVPPIAIFLAHHPMVDQFDLSATKFLVSGAAPMGKEVETLVSKRLNVQVKQAYGMTEASPAVNWTEDDKRKTASVGRILPMTELRVKCTNTDKDLPHNETGELLFRGPQVMLGYHQNDEANQKTLMPDGFLRTGDIGYIDENGFVHIVDRVKEIIKYKGHQVAPAELEDVLNNHPEIVDACAVRGFDAQGEEIPKAFVVTKNPNLTAEAVMEFVASKVAPFKKVREVEFLEAIPKSPTGKILRRQLQELENKRFEQSQQAAAA